MRRTLIVFARAARLGRGKRRLARDIGMVWAWRFQRVQTAALLRRLAADRRWRTVLAVTPDRAAAEPRPWPASCALLPQGTGDLGSRMARALAAPPPGPVVLVGADVPGIAPRHVADAFRALGDHDVVFGPALDGGYWLIGLRRRPRPAPRGFGRVRWSTAHALADSIAAIGPGRRVALVDELEDVDDGAAWRRWRAATRRGPSSRAPAGGA
ncbi:MAG: TIGR04282 family arsenosugar biosynthesis glycosyltransferase [Alphaproteobacteria bacterium]|nr:TIGR04282 family arsenosugar biosynthesis glycosyltransferase [Alphaproteobacteria bacterium]